MHFAGIFLVYLSDVSFCLHISKSKVFGEKRSTGWIYIFNRIFQGWSENWIQQGKGHDDLGNGSSEGISRDETLTVVSSRRKRRGAGDTEYRQLLRANLCFFKYPFFIQGWGKLQTWNDDVCESKGAGQSAASQKAESTRPRQADLYPVSWSPCLVPVLALLPLQGLEVYPFTSCWRAQSLEKVWINSVPLRGNIFQGERALPGQGTLPRTPLIQWYLQLDTLPVDKAQPAITSLQCF